MRRLSVSSTDASELPYVSPPRHRASRSSTVTIWTSGSAVAAGAPALAAVSALPGASVVADVSVLPGFAVSVVASGFAEVSGLVVSPASGTGQLLNGSRNFESDAARALSGAAASEAEITREKIPVKATDARFRFMGGSLSFRQVRLYNAIVLARQANYQSLWATGTGPYGTSCPIQAPRQPRASLRPHTARQSRVSRQLHAPRQPRAPQRLHAQQPHAPRRPHAPHHRAPWQPHAPREHAPTQAPS